MRWWYRCMMAFRILFHRRAARSQLDEELAFHLEHQIAENIASGMSPHEARYAALRTFGGNRNPRAGRSHRLRRPRLARLTPAPDASPSNGVNVYPHRKARKPKPSRPFFVSSRQIYNY